MVLLDIVCDEGRYSRVKLFTHGQNRSYVGKSRRVERFQVLEWATNAPARALQGMWNRDKTMQYVQVELDLALWHTSEKRRERWEQTSVNVIFLVESVSLLHKGRTFSLALVVPTQRCEVRMFIGICSLDISLNVPLA